MERPSVLIVGAGAVGLVVDHGGKVPAQDIEVPRADLLQRYGAHCTQPARSPA